MTTVRHPSLVFIRRCFVLFTLLLCAGVTAAAPPGFTGALDEIGRAGDVAAAAYRPEPATAERTASEFSRLYFDVFEAAGLELALGSRDRAQMQRVELGFARCIQAAMERRTVPELQAAWASLQGELITSTALLNEAGEAGRWGAFTQSALILLREGAEAILVTAALAAFLRRTGQAARLPWLWGGVAAAALCSAVLAWSLGGVLDASGSWRGALQAGVVLLAALTMAQVSAWLYARRSAERWNQFLRRKLAGGLDETPWLTATVAFLAVFREGAETLLFYQALSGTMPGQATMLWLGGGTAALVLVALFWLVVRAGVRLPFTPFFTVTATLLLVLSIVFAGQAVLALQLAGVLSTTDWPWLPTVGWLGLYPSRESVGLQLLLLAAVLSAVMWSTRAASRERRQVPGT